MATKHQNEDKALNWDPVSGLPGAHPVGIGVGTALGGVAIGAAGEAVAGPVAAAVGALVGGIGGGLAGKAVAESMNPAEKEVYWRETYPTRPYYEEETRFETYAPAYQYGWESRARYHDREFDEVEPQLRSDWEKSEHSSNLAWERAKHAVWDAWHDIERALPGDADRDGR